MIYYYGPTVEEEQYEESPTDTSEDSIEVAVRPIMRNKRKSLEPRRFRIHHKLDSPPNNDALMGSPPPSSLSPDYNKNNERRRPASPCRMAPKKRFKLEALLDLEAAAAESRLQPPFHEVSTAATTGAPFRPWAAEAAESSSKLRIPEKYLMMMMNPMEEPEQDEPLALVVVKKEDDDLSPIKSEPELADRGRVGYPLERSPPFPLLRSPPSSPLNDCRSPPEGRKQTNYKSLTKDRRVEANARERQRVHTITAAFDTLQAAIPCEDENSKLSKLSVIKIATAYIMALSRMAGYDYTEDQSAPSLDTVVQHCQEVIHTETRIKTRKS